MFDCVCNEDCFNCPYSDCRLEVETRKSKAFSRMLDRWVVDWQLNAERERRGVSCGSAYYRANKESRLVYQRRYYWEHRDERIDYQLRRYREKRIVLIAYQSARYYDNRSKLCSYQIDRYYNHQDNLRSYQRSYYWFRRSFAPD